MVIIKYRIFLGSAHILAVSVTKESSFSVWLPGFTIGEGPAPAVKHPKVTKDRQYHDTWALAHAALTAGADERLRWARRELEMAEAYAGSVKGMKPPEEATE